MGPAERGEGVEPWVDHRLIKLLAKQDYNPCLHSRPITRKLLPVEYVGVADGEPSTTEVNARSHHVGQSHIRIRQLVQTPQQQIDDWFYNIGIQLGDMITTEQQRRDVRRLCYTYKDAFVSSLNDIKPTSLVTHHIELDPSIPPPRRAPVIRYSKDKRDFINSIIP